MRIFRSLLIAGLGLCCSFLHAQTKSFPVQQEVQKLDADALAKLTGMSSKQAMDVVRESAAELSAATQYCTEVERFAGSHQPLLFAAGAPDGSGPGAWRQFASRTEWEQASRPMPAALVWFRGGRIVAARFALTERGEVVPADYCFRPDGSLARLSVSPGHPKTDRFGLETQVTVGREWIYLPNGKKIFQLQHAFDQGPLKSERTVFIYPTAPGFRSVSELPFIPLLIRRCEWWRETENSRKRPENRIAAHRAGPRFSDVPIATERKPPLRWIAEWSRRCR